jgi:hypothetical protein
MRARLVLAGLPLTLNIRRVATAWEPTAPQRSSISRGRAVCGNVSAYRYGGGAHFPSGRKDDWEFRARSRQDADIVVRDHE